ncbi:MAG: hypothetical protein QHH06_08635 [Clostridiales bacterium]|jgi:hypothetical protein|nr:hypothetical protein [Eubacteriales bacterium]MDH7566533.1 hypothetical protein [Clostridiales bacterium]
MNDDLNKKIKQVADMLSQENMPENVKELLSLLTSSDNKDESSPKAVQMPERKDDKPNGSELEESLDMVRKVTKIMDRLNNTKDPSINLLHSIKPFLNAKRQKRLDGCIKLIQLSRLSRLMDESEKEQKGE